MNIKEDQDYEDENERTKLFLNIKSSLDSDKIFNISEDKKVLTLLENITLDDPKKTKKIELNKIFSHKDENSYVYEEIMRNCVKNSIEGANFTFISYGDSNSERHNLIIGSPDCYENIANRGLLPRLLESYINKINSNHILAGISLNISYIFINNNNFIDLSQLMGKDNKTLKKINKEELIKNYSKDINNENILKNVKKSQILKANDSLYFLLQILKLLNKIEETNNHFLTWSYFIILIYVTDAEGKTVSTLSFIIMPGNEILLHRFQKKNIIGMDRRDSIGMRLKNNAFECFYVIEDIYKYLDAKNLEDNKGNNTEPNDSNKMEHKIDIKSKLFNIIGDLAFDVGAKSPMKNRKYIIIGSVLDNPGQITNIKDTLQFLFQCQKISYQKLKNKIPKEMLVDRKYYNDKLKVKNELIYDLESKLKTQETKFDELTSEMDFKEHNVKALQDIYKKQIEILKGEFDFNGDINNLLTGNKKAHEYLYTSEIRSINDNNHLKNLKIEELKKQIVKIETLIKQLKMLLDVKENDAIMLEILKTIREAKEKKRKENEIRNLLSDKIKELMYKNKILEGKIKGVKNEINTKKKLMNELPELFNRNINIKDALTKMENKINDMNKDYSLKIIGNNNEGIKKAISDENKEKDILVDKYENFVGQNKKEIIHIKKAFDNINVQFNFDKKAILDELVTLYKCIIFIIKLYRKAFKINCSIFLRKEKFDKLLEKEEKNINSFKFPILYDELGKIGYAHFRLNNKKIRPKLKIIKSKYYKDIREEDILLEEKEKKENNFESSKTNERIEKIFDYIKKGNAKLINDIINPPINEIIEQKKKVFNGIVKKNHFQFVAMTREELQQYSKKFTEKIEIIENFINKYIENMDSNQQFNPVQEKVNEIKKKLKYLDYKIKEVTNKYENNNIIFESGDKVIQRLKNENYLLKRQLFGLDKTGMFSTISPTSTHHIYHNQFKKRNNSNKNNIKLNLNNINTLTTCSSIGIYGQFTLQTNSKGFQDQNIYTIPNEKRTIDTEDFSDSYKSDFFKDRAISSYNKLSPYYIVAENLK